VREVSGVTAEHPSEAAESGPEWFTFAQSANHWFVNHRAPIDALRPRKQKTRQPEEVHVMCVRCRWGGLAVG